MTDVDINKILCFLIRVRKMGNDNLYAHAVQLFQEFVAGIVAHPAQSAADVVLLRTGKPCVVQFLRAALVQTQNMPLVRKLIRFFHKPQLHKPMYRVCLLYTSDAADD